MIPRIYLDKLKHIINVLPFRTSIFLMVIFSGLIIWINRLLIYYNIISSEHTGLSVYFGDFDVLYRSSVRYLVSGQIYGDGYAYPPLSFFSILPLGFLSRDMALIAKTVFDIICYAITLYYILKILKGYNNIEFSKFQRVALFISILLFYPVTVSFAAGAINAQILVLTTISYYYLFIKKKITTSSIIICLATINKVIPFDLILLNKKLRIRTTLLVLSSFIFSIYLFGLKIHIDWIKYLIITQNIMRSTSEVLNPVYSTDMNTSISLLIYKIIAYIGQPILATDLMTILLITKIIIIVYFIWFIHKTYKYNVSKEMDILYFSLLILLPLLLSNTTWSYYWVFMITPIILWIYVLKLTKYDKTILFISIFLMTTQGFIGSAATIIGGTIKSLVFIIQPITIASILMFIFIWNKIKKYGKNLEKNELL